MVSWDIFVRPLEPLFWGPPRSGCAGEAHHVSSEFPPPIPSWQGLLRTQLLRAMKPGCNLNALSVSSLTERIGKPDQLPEGWQFTGPYPACYSEEKTLTPWLPVPLYVMSNKKKTRYYYAQLLDAPTEGMNDNNTLGKLLGRPDVNEKITPLKGWCSAKTLFSILSGQVENKEWKKQDFELPKNGITSEIHAGLALEKSNGRSATAKHDMLYFLKQIRTSDKAGFYGRLTFSKQPPNALTAFPEGQGAWGRRGRAVALETAGRLCEDWLKLGNGEHLPQRVSENEAFWLITLSPFALDDPHNPWPKRTDYTVLGFITGKPIIQGGFDMTTGKPRHNKLLLPAGSAWLFQLKGGNEKSRAKRLRELNNAFPLGDDVMSPFGFGHTLVGKSCLKI